MNLSSRRSSSLDKRLVTNLHRVNNPVRALVHSQGFLLFALAAAHPLLALAMRYSNMVATLHAWASVSLGVFLALFSKDPRKPAFVAAYIAGSEVLWRMTSAMFFWEGGKYFVSLILGIVLLRTHKWKNAFLPLVYFALLCISIPLTLDVFGFSSLARNAISFNLSGPLALSVAAIFFLQMELDEQDMFWMVWWTMLPAFGIAGITLGGMASLSAIQFTNEANFLTSGGFGPNQVSAALGLAGGLSFLLFIHNNQKAARWISFGLTFTFLTLSALTFSRGGLYNAAAMILLALIHFLRDRRQRLSALIALLLVSLGGGYFIYPRLNELTGGMLQERFTNLDTTLRADISRADLDLWLQNPVFGVGPGVSKSERAILNRVNTHTEYTRLLAEHGIPGILAIAALMFMLFRAYFSLSQPRAQAWSIALAAWALVEMSHSAMRIALISFIFGLALAQWKQQPEPSHKMEPQK